MADPALTIRDLENENGRLCQEIQRLAALHRADLVKALGLAREANDALVLGNRPDAQGRIRELCSQLTVALGGA